MNNIFIKNFNEYGHTVDDFVIPYNKYCGLFSDDVGGIDTVTIILENYPIKCIIFSEKNCDDFTYILKSKKDDESVLEGVEFHNYKCTVIFS